MVYGIPINDTVTAGVVHRHATKRELSVAYWRDVVIWGKDFLFLENNLHNTYASRVQTLSNTYERLSRYGQYDKEDDIKCLRRVATRLCELNIFLELFNPSLTINWDYILKLPVKAMHQQFSFEEATQLYEQTFIAYNNLKEKFLA